MASELFYLPGRSAINLSGFVASGAVLSFFETGTSTPLAVYSDAGLTTSLGTTVTANAAGKFPDIYLDDAEIYRVRCVQDGVTLFDVDPYYPGDAAEATDELLLASAQAQTARDVAITAGPYYTTIAEGEAATTTGQEFAVAPGDGTVTWYRRTGGGSTEIFSPITESALGGVGGAALVGVEGGGNVQDALDDVSGQTTLAQSFRATPNAVFNWLSIKARPVRPGLVEVSENIPAYAKRVHSGLIGAGVVYVDPVNGSDSNSGAITSPVQTLNYALRTAAPSQVYLMGSSDKANPAVFRKSDFRNTDTPGNKIKIVTPLGHCRVEEEGPDAPSLTWTSPGGIYDTTPTLVGGIPPVTIEYSGWTRGDGEPFRVPFYATSTEINTVGGGLGWSWDGTKIYLRIGSLNVESNKAKFKITYANSNSRCLIFNTKILFDVGPGNSLVFNGVYLAPFYNSGRPYLYARGIEIRNCVAHGVDAQGAYYAMQDCYLFANRQDNFHPADGSGFSTLAAEINCISREAGDFDTFGVTSGGTNNGSSMHGAGSVMRWGGEYNRNGGPNIVDTGTGKSWNVAVKTGESRATGNGFGFYATTSSVEMWLDSCHADREPTTEIRATDGCSIHRYATTSDRADTVGTGTIDTFTPTAV